MYYFQTCVFLVEVTHDRTVDVTHYYDVARTKDQRPWGKAWVWTTTVPSTIVLGENPGMFPLGRRRFPSDHCVHLDLCICTIPTVGFNEKHGGEATTSPEHFS